MTTARIHPYLLVGALSCLLLSGWLSAGGVLVLCVAVMLFSELIGRYLAQGAPAPWFRRVSTRYLLLCTAYRALLPLCAGLFLLILTNLLSIVPSTFLARFFRGGAISLFMLALHTRLLRKKAKPGRFALPALTFLFILLTLYWLSVR